MTDPNAPKVGFLNRTAQNIQAVKADVFEQVPVAVQERLSAEARVGVGLAVLGAVVGLYTLHLAVTLKNPDWKILAVLGVPAALLIMGGGGLISKKLWATVFGSVGALWRSIRGQTPPTGGAS